MLVEYYFLFKLSNFTMAVFSSTGASYQPSMDLDVFRRRYPAVYMYRQVGCVEVVVICGFSRL